MNKLFKSFMLISIILLLPLSSMAEDRIRFNYRISGSLSNPELGSKTVGSTYYQTGSTANLATGKDTLDGDVSYSSFSLHYISSYGMDWLGDGEILLGLFSYNKSYTTQINTTSNWFLNHPLAGWTAVAANGTPLGTRKSSGTSRSLDIGYVYPMDDMSFGGGIALPILGGSAETKVEWTGLGAYLSGMASSQVATTETLEPKGAGGLSSNNGYFLNFGYAFGSFEGIINYRSHSSKTEAALNKSKGVGALLGKDVLETSGTDTIISIGFGYLF